MNSILKRIRPTILLAVLSLGIMGVVSLMLGTMEVTTAVITALAGIAGKIMDSEEQFGDGPTSE